MREWVRPSKNSSDHEYARGSGVRLVDGERTER